MSIQDSYFRQVMRRVPTGVTLVTVRDGKVIHGMTANTFTSVSLTPTLVLICVIKESRTHQLISHARNFAVNVLSATQRPVAERFAHQAPVPDDPFADIAFHAIKTGAPILDDCIAFVDCRLASAHDAGDHTIFVGEVLELGFGLSKEDAPLLWVEGHYHALNAT